MILAALALLLTPDSKQFYFDENWTVFENESDCSMIAAYKGGSFLHIAYDFRLGRTTISVTDPAFKSAEAGKTYDLTLYFRKGQRLDDGWGTVHAHGFRMSNGGGISFTLKGPEALADVASSDLLALMRDEIVVSSLPLTGSAKAVPQL